MGFLTKLFGGSSGPPITARDLGRNQKCWCGSGQKYKSCHLERDERHKARERAAACTTGG